MGWFSRAKKRLKKNIKKVASSFSVKKVIARAGKVAPVLAVIPVGGVFISALTKAAQAANTVNKARQIVKSGGKSIAKAQGKKLAKSIFRKLF